MVFGIRGQRTAGHSGTGIHIRHCFIKGEGVTSLYIASKMDLAKNINRSSIALRQLPQFDLPLEIKKVFTDPRKI